MSGVLRVTVGLPGGRPAGTLIAAVQRLGAAPSLVMQAKSLRLQVSPSTPIPLGLVSGGLRGPQGPRGDDATTGEVSYDPLAYYILSRN